MICSVASQLNTDHEKLATFLSQVKRLTPVSNDQVTLVNVDRALTPGIFEELRKDIGTLLHSFEKENFLVISSQLDSEQKAQRVIVSGNFAESLASELKEAQRTGFIESRFRGFKKLMSDKELGKNLDLLFSTLDYLLRVKESSHNHVFRNKIDTVLDRIVGTLSEGFKKLTDIQTNQILNFISRLDIYSKVLPLMQIRLATNQNTPKLQSTEASTPEIGVDLAKVA